MKLAFARLNQEISGLELELLGEEGLRYDDWTMRRPEQRRLHRPRRRLPLPARQGQLDRGRHLGDPAQHRRRAGARPARRAPRRQGRRLEGPRRDEPTLDLLYTEVRTTLRASVRDLLADRCAADAVLARVRAATGRTTPTLWKALAAEHGPGRAAGARGAAAAQGASAREAAVVLEELGRAVAPVPFLTSAVVATDGAAAPCDAATTCWPRSRPASATAALASCRCAAAPAPASGRSYAPRTAPCTGAVTSVADAVDGRRAAGAGGPGRRAATRSTRPPRRSTPWCRST